MNDYHFFLIIGLVVIPYLYSLYLVKRGKVELFKQKQFWNIVLLGSFLISGILGLILAFCIDQKLSIDWYRPMLWWHVETGICMATIAIFHTLWHFGYYKTALGKK